MCYRLRQAYLEAPRGRDERGGLRTQVVLRPVGCWFYVTHKPEGRRQAMCAARKAPCWLL